MLLEGEVKGFLLTIMLNRELLAAQRKPIGIGGTSLDVTIDDDLGGQSITALVVCLDVYT